MAADEDHYVEHPNRQKASSQVTRGIVVLLLLVSAALVAIVTIGGWSALEGAKALQIALIVVDLVMAFLVARWHRGVLPVVAAIAVLLGIFGAIAAPAWFDRDQAGFVAPALPEDVLGLLCAVLVAIQAALIVFSLQGFRQAWNVEVERPAPAAA